MCNKLGQPGRGERAPQQCAYRPAGHRHRMLTTTGERGWSLYKKRRRGIVPNVQEPELTREGGPGAVCEQFSTFQTGVDCVADLTR